MLYSCIPINCKRPDLEDIIYILNTWYDVLLIHGPIKYYYYACHPTMCSVVLINDWPKVKNSPEQKRGSILRQISFWGKQNLYSPDTQSKALGQWLGILFFCSWFFPHTCKVENNVFSPAEILNIDRIVTRLDWSILRRNVTYTPLDKWRRGRN